MTGLMILVSVTQTAKADTVTYFISVTIPAIPGVNVGPFDDRSVRGQLAANNSPQDLDLVEEEVIRGNQRFILNTLVPR